MGRNKMKTKRHLNESVKQAISLNEKMFGKGRIIESDASKLPAGILCRVRYPICIIDKKNRNSRIYRKPVWEGVMKNPDVLEKLEHRNLFGNQEHPIESQLKLNKDDTSHIISKIIIEDKEHMVYADFDVLPTEAGRFINVLLEAGCDVGVSTRAEGELEEKIEEASGEKYYDVVPDAYNFITVDFTADPSTVGTFPIEVQKNVLNHVKSSYESHRINGNVACALLGGIKTKEAVALMESIKKVRVFETGEMSSGNIAQGGEDYEWAKAIEDDVKKLVAAVKGKKVEFLGMQPFDKYQGPYAEVKIDGKLTKFWDAGVAGETVLYMTPEDWVGTWETLANAISGDEAALRQVKHDAKKAAGEPVPDDFDPRQKEFPFAQECKERIMKIKEKEDVGKTTVLDKGPKDDPKAKSDKTPNADAQKKDLETDKDGSQKKDVVKVGEPQDKVTILDAKEDKEAEIARETEAMNKYKKHYADLKGDEKTDVDASVQNMMRESLTDLELFGLISVQEEMEKDSAFVAEMQKMNEVTPPGWEKTVKKMKKHEDIKSPYAMAWYMKKKGFKPTESKVREIKMVARGLLVGNDKEWKEIEDEFVKQGFSKPKLIGSFKTLPGQGGKGGRNDVVIDLKDKDIPKMAVHSFHLGGLFSWAEDYIDNSKDIIPDEGMKLLESKVNIEENFDEMVEFFKEEFKKIKPEKQKRIRNILSETIAPSDVQKGIRDLKVSLAIAEARLEKLIEIHEELRAKYVKDALEYTGSIKKLEEERFTLADRVVEKVKEKFETAAKTEIKKIQNALQKEIKETKDSISGIKAEHEQKIAVLTEGQKVAVDEAIAKKDEEIKILQEAHTKELLKKYFETKVSVTGLAEFLPKNALTLVERCVSEGDIDKLIDKLREEVRLGLSNPVISKVEVASAVTPAIKAITDRVQSIMEKCNP